MYGKYIIDDNHSVVIVKKNVEKVNVKVKVKGIGIMSSLAFGPGVRIMVAESPRTRYIDLFVFITLSSL